MTDYFQSILGYVVLHPELAIITAFFVAAGEALLVVGLFVPSTVILVGIGGLIGLGKVSFWPIFIATTLGAAVGDALSYWIGHHYKAHLAEIWPFRRYRGLLTSGQRYFVMHGGKSVFVGRFIPGIKAVVPAIAGMMGMSVVRFTALNVLSAIAWTGAHLLPGLSAGLLLASLGTISKRLAVLAGLLVVGIALLLWLAKIVIGLGVRYLPLARKAAMKLADSRHDRFGILVARVVAPQHADFRVLVALNAILIGTIIMFAGLLEDVVTRDTIVQFDDAFSQFLQSLRTNWGDHMMVAITMLGDWIVTTAVASASAIVLLAAKRYRLAIGLALTLIGTMVFVQGMKLIVHVSRPLALYSGADAFSFPSGHSTMTATIYGIIGLMAFRGAGSLVGRITVVLCAILIALVAFSRLYLAAHWPSDVAAGLLFGAGATAVFALVFRNEALPARLAGSMLAASAIVLLLVGTLHINRGYAQALAFYAPQQKESIPLSLDWREGGWRELPSHRIDLAGEKEEPFVLQWNGSKDALQTALQNHGWIIATAWSLTSLNGFAQATADPLKLPAIPKLHDGHVQTIAMVKTDLGAGRSKRFVFRAWPQTVKLGNGPVVTIFLGSILVESIEHPLNLLSIPVRDEGDTCDANVLIGDLPGISAGGERLDASDGACAGRLVLASPAIN